MPDQLENCMLKEMYIDIYQYINLLKLEITISLHEFVLIKSEINVHICIYYLSLCFDILIYVSICEFS